MKRNGDCIEKEQETERHSDNNEPPTQKCSKLELGVDYDPSKDKYHPVNDAFWKHGEE